MDYYLLIMHYDTKTNRNHFALYFKTYDDKQSLLFINTSKLAAIMLTLYFVLIIFCFQAEAIIQRGL